jgi:hypothetical protein
MAVESPDMDAMARACSARGTGARFMVFARRAAENRKFRYHSQSRAWNAKSLVSVTECRQ